MTKQIGGERFTYIKGFKRKRDAEKLASMIRREDKRKVRVIKNPRKNWQWPWGVYSGPKKRKRSRKVGQLVRLGVYNIKGVGRRVVYTNPITDSVFYLKRIKGMKVPKVAYVTKDGRGYRRK